MIFIFIIEGKSMNDTNQTVDNISILASVTNPEWVAIVISIISAVFAIWSWREAKKANKISIHPKQIEIYDAFNELILYVEQEGMSLKAEEVAKFYKISQNVVFYFDEIFAKQLNRYFDVCWELADLNRKYLRDINQSKDTVLKGIEEEQDMLFDEEIRLSNEIKAKFKSVLKL